LSATRAVAPNKQQIPKHVEESGRGSSCPNTSLATLSTSTVLIGLRNYVPEFEPGTYAIHGWS
jgi:hypothetical protein